MATTFYLAAFNGNADTDPPGHMSSDYDFLLRSTRDVGVGSQEFKATVAGPTPGEQVTSSGTGVPISWWSNPLNAVTIAGTVTLNVWMAESDMTANVGAQIIIDRVDGSGAFISTILNTEKGTEIPLTTRAAQNWTAAPTSTALVAGDRLRVRVLGNDVGTMASGSSFNSQTGAASAGVDGDSFVTFTETITEAPTNRGIAPRVIRQAVNRASIY